MYLRRLCSFAALKIFSGCSTIFYCQATPPHFLNYFGIFSCCQEKQSIRQYHYNAWPDHGKPDSPDPIIKMIEMINNYRKRTDVPLVVHCRLSGGRGWGGVEREGLRQGARVSISQEKGSMKW